MFNSFILLTIVLLSIIVYYAFVLPKKERMLFRMYRERDNLTIYAMNTPGKQDEEAYQYLIELINTEIYLMKNSISLTDYYKSTVEKSVENEQTVEKIIKLIKEDKFMDEVYEKTSYVFYKYFYTKFKWFNRIFLCPLSVVLKILLKLLNWLNKGDLSEKEQKMNTIFSTASNIPKVYEKYVKLVKA